MALVLQSRPVTTGTRLLTAYERAHRLVHAYGSDTLAYFALRDDKRYFFSSDGEAMIAYARLGHYALVSGDPVGRPESIDLVISEFLRMCRRRGWRSAFLAVRESETVRYTTLGLRTFYLGEEAVIDCAAFTLDGKRNKSMRQSVQRVARTHRFEMMAESDASTELVAQLNEVSRRWRGKAPERGFTMALGQAIEGVNPEYQLCVAFDEHGVPGGFLRLVPLFGGERGMTLDMMRHDPEAPNGMTEFLVANAVFTLCDRGSRQLSMNFAVMARLFAPDADLTRRQRLLKAVVSLANPYFQIKSLHDFTRRFRPIWRPRVIVYDGALPWIAILYSGLEGHLALPLIGRFFVPPRFDHDRDSVRTGAPDPAPAPASFAAATLGGPGRLFDVADEAVQVLKPHDVRAVAVDVEAGIGDAPGDELGVGCGDETVLAAVGDERRHIDALESGEDTGIGGEGPFGVVLTPVDRLREHERVARADLDDIQHLLHIRVPLGGAGGREGQVEELVEVARAEGGIGGGIGLHAGRPAGGGPREHQRARLAPVAGGEGEGDLATGGPPDDRRARDAERVDERRQVVRHLPDRERCGGGVGAVPDAAQVVGRDLVMRRQPAGKLGAPHRHGGALPDDQDHGRAAPDLAVADRDAVGLHLSHRAEEGEVSAGLGAGDLVTDHGNGSGRVRAAVLGRGQVGGARVDRAGGARRRDEGQEGDNRSQTW
jgi:hypothetical protein